MKFVIRKASDPFIIIETVDISTLDDLKKIQEIYGSKLIVDFKEDWFGYREDENHNMPSIMIYDDHVE